MCCMLSIHTYLKEGRHWTLATAVGLNLSLGLAVPPGAKCKPPREPGCRLFKSNRMAYTVVAATTTVAATAAAADTTKTRAPTPLVSWLDGWATLSPQPFFLYYFFGQKTTRKARNWTIICVLLHRICVWMGVCGWVWVCVCACLSDCSPEPLAVNILTINYFLICLKVTLLATTNKNNVYSIDAEFSRRNLQYIIYIFIFKKYMYISLWPVSYESRTFLVFRCSIHYIYIYLYVYLLSLNIWLYYSDWHSSFLLALWIVIFNIKYHQL